MKNDKISEFNILPFLSEAFATNKRIYKKIDELYNTNPDMFYEYATKSEFYNSKICTEGNIEQEYYYKKSLGILITMDNKENLEQIIKLIEYGWKYSASYVNSHKFISLKDFISKYIKKKHGITNVADDELNSAMLITVILARYKNLEIDLNDEYYALLIKSLVLRLEKYNNSSFNLSLNNISKEHRNKIQKLELKLKNRNKYLYFPLGSSVIYNEKITKNDFYYIKSNLSLNEKFLLATEYIYDLENLSLTTVVGNEIFKSKDIQELMLCYTNLFKENDDINIEELEKFLYSAIQIRYLCRFYKKAKQFFFDNFQEELQNQNSFLKKQINELIINNKNIVADNNVLIKQNEQLLRENDRLKAELKENENNKKELIALREYIFNSQQEYVENDSNDIDINYINSIKGVIVGGNPNWQLRMKEKLPNWIFIEPTYFNFNKSILNNKYVFININISHAMYYKIIENLSKNSKLYYLNNININICLKEIYDIVINN